MNLKKDMDFLVEIDKMKNIFRKTKNLSNNKFENDAEHSYHVATMAMILSSYCDEEIDVNKVIKMLLVHDIIEIYAGDTFAYDKEGYKDKYEREQKAADKIFGLLSKEKNIYFRNLYEEFENMNTKESRFANLIDRIQPMLLNYLNDGGSWVEYNISKEMVLKRLDDVKISSSKLYEFTKGFIEDYFRGRGSF